MTGFTDYWARQVLNHSTGKTAIASLPTVYMGLFTAVGTDAGTGFTEVSGGAYARAATSGATWNNAGASAPSNVTNSGDIIFPTSTAAWGTLLGVGAFDASTVGNLLWWDYLGQYNWLPFTGSAASPCVLTAPTHGFLVGDQVVVNSEYGGVLPPTAGSWSGLLTIASGITTDTFNVGVNTTATGSGSVRKVVTLAPLSGSTIRFAGGTPGNLLVSLA